MVKAVKTREPAVEGLADPAGGEGRMLLNEPVLFVVTNVRSLSRARDFCAKIGTNDEEVEMGWLDKLLGREKRTGSQTSGTGAMSQGSEAAEPTPSAPPPTGGAESGAGGLGREQTGGQTGEESRPT